MSNHGLDKDGWPSADTVLETERAANARLLDNLKSCRKSAIAQAETIERLTRAHADALDEVAALREKVRVAVDALERGQGCIKGLLARTPVRDVSETLAEIDAALASLREGAK
jgi:hypothetical protein